MPADIAENVKTTEQAAPEVKPPEQKPEAKPSPVESPKKSFTQDQLNKMVLREKKHGRNQVLKDIGVDPSDTNAIEALKKFVESQKTETQKAVESKVSEVNAILEAEKRAMLAETKIEAMRLGVQPQFVDDAIVLITAKLGDEENDIKTLVGELKIKYPSWFVQDESAKETVGKRGTGQSVNPNKTLEGSDKGLGARLASARVSNGKKSNFWS